MKTNIFKRETVPFSYDNVWTFNAKQHVINVDGELVIDPEVKEGFRQWGILIQVDPETLKDETVRAQLITKHGINDEMLLHKEVADGCAVVIIDFRSYKVQNSAERDLIISSTEQAKVSSLK